MREVNQQGHEPGDRDVIWVGTLRQDAIRLAHGDFCSIQLL